MLIQYQFLPARLLVGSWRLPRLPVLPRNMLVTTVLGHYLPMHNTNTPITTALLSYSLECASPLLVRPGCMGEGGETGTSHRVALKCCAPVHGGDLALQAIYGGVGAVA